ncbi:MAG: glycosyltransferase [Pseudomonadota bacterium]
MARILFTWELGGGLGHIQPIRESVAKLHKDHECYAALRELDHAHGIMSGLDVTLLAAPFFSGVVDRPIKNSLCFADLLYNCGYHTEGALASRLRAWQALYDMIQPDIVVYDHSPTALLAATGYHFKKLVAGSGFICPPPESPLGVFFPKQMSAEQMKGIRASEVKVLDTVNGALASLGQAPLQQLGDIYRQADKTLLTTLPALDHFPWRPEASYVGVPSVSEKPAPEWPPVPGKRVFAYLKPFKKLPQLLQSLKDSGQPIIIYSNNIDTGVLEQFKAPNMHFTQKAIDLQKLAKECDAAILNSNHGTTAELLLGAVPMVLLPLQKEQQVLAQRLAETGCCTMAYHDDIHAVIGGLNQVIHQKSYHQKALSLALQQPAPTHGGDAAVAEVVESWSREPAGNQLD